MESNNSIEELIIRYLQNEIQEDELRVLDAWIHESDANKAHFFELKERSGVLEPLFRGA